jgi:hypothetical protein
VGASALAANSSGIQTVAIGANAGQYQTNNNNTAVGFNSLVGVSGSSNGGSNTAVGSNSLAGLTSGNFNTGIGQQALVANTTASNNTAVGYQSLYRNTAANNTAFGFSAGYQITSGTSNTALGYYAMGSNGGGITGSSNTAVGNAALTSVSSGGSNVAIGGDALYGMTTASYSTAVGFQAGYSSVSADYNTFIGYYAGRSTTGDQNTFVGKFSGNAVTTGTLNTIIGAYNGNQGGLDIRTLSNYIVLSDGGGTPRFYSDTNGVVYDGNGKLRAVPQSGAAKSTSYTLATTDVGEFINVVSGGAIVIPNATFATGDVITIFNNNTSTMTITCSISTALIAGNSTDKATMTLAVAGVATILFINSTECVVSGNVT